MILSYSTVGCGKEVCLSIKSRFAAASVRGRWYLKVFLRFLLTRRLLSLEMLQDGRFLCVLQQFVFTSQYPM